MLKAARKLDKEAMKMASEQGEFEFNQWYYEHYQWPQRFIELYERSKGTDDTGYNLDPAFPDHWAHYLWEQAQDEAAQN